MFTLLNYRLCTVKNLKGQYDSFSYIYMIAPMRKGSLWHFFHNFRFLLIYIYICQKIKVMKFHEDPITINIFIGLLKLRHFYLWRCSPCDVTLWFYQRHFCKVYSSIVLFVNYIFAFQDIITKFFFDSLLITLRNNNAFILHNSCTLKM